MNTKEVIDWNELFWNERWEIWFSLERSLIYEEYKETIDALFQEDPKEIIDWACDIIFVLIWTLHKLGLTANQIDQAFAIVCESNLSKLWANKDEKGKVSKWSNFKEPDFTEILKDLRRNDHSNG